MNPLCKPWEHAASRRQFLGASAGALAFGALGGMISPQAAEAMRKKEKQVLFVWLDGGMSQLESWDPKPNTEFGGPFRTIKTSVPGTHFSELMPQCAKQAHRLCVVRNIATKDNAHSSGVARIQRGDPKNRGVAYPFFGSSIAKLMGPTASKLPAYVWVKPGSGGFKAEDAGFLGPKYGSLAFGDGKPPEDLLRHASLTVEEDEERNELRELLNQRYTAQRRPTFTEASSFVFDSARELMKRADVFDTTKLPAKELDRYGRTEIGQHMMVARNMLEAGVRFVKVGSYGWDTHGDNFNASASLVPKFDRAFAAIIEDLAATGLLDHTLVIAMSEFGRTPRINANISRDHWPQCYTALLAGAGVKKGFVYGASDKHGEYPADKPVKPDDLAATIYHLLGIDPHTEVRDTLNRPVPISYGKAITDVMV